MNTQNEIDERAYCTDCFTNLNDDEFDYRFNYPLCLKCGPNHEHELTPNQLEGLEETQLSKCCNAALVTDFDSEKSHSWQDVAEAPLVCEICGLLDAPETPDTETVLLEMLTENTGISIMDSGGDAGRAWQRNQAKGVEALKAQPVAYMSDGMPTLSSFHFLKEQLKFAPALDLSLRSFMQKSSNSYREDVSDWLDFLGVPKEIEGADFYEAPRYEINTYNHEYCLLDQTLQYVTFQLNNVGYVALQIHGGADVRGGYTAPRVFEADRESLVFDSQSTQLKCQNCKLSLNFYAGSVDVVKSPTLNAEKFNDLVLNGPDFDLTKWDFWQAGCPNCAAHEWRG